MKSVRDREPENTKTDEREKSTDEKNKPRWEFVAGNTRKKTNIFTNIIGYTKHCNLALVETKNGFEGGRVEWKCVGVSYSNLNPYGSS